MEGTDSVSGGNSAPAAEAPTSFEQAFASDASPASGTPEQSNDATAAVQPATGAVDPTPATGERSPFIPRERFDEVNARLNELKAWKEQHGWVDQIPQDKLQAAMQFYSQFQTGDPVELLQQLAAQVQAHPEHGARLKSLAARTLAARSQPAAQLPRIQLEDGQVVDLNELKSQWMQEALNTVEQKYAPVVQTAEQLKAEREAVALQRQAEQFGATTFDDLKTWPGMDDAENRKAVAEAIKAMQLQSDDPREVTLALNAAYRKVVLPKLSTKAQSALLDNLQQKAAASTAVNPGSATPSTPKRVTSFHDASLSWG